MERLQEEGIISKKELQDMIEQIGDYNFEWEVGEQTSIMQYQKEKSIIVQLLKEKWIIEDIVLENIISEGEMLPKWIASISGEIHLAIGTVYEFWLRWDKGTVDPETWKNGYYTLGGDAWTIEKYGRSFFVEATSD